MNRSHRTADNGCHVPMKLAERVGFEPEIFRKLLWCRCFLVISHIFKLLVRMPFCPPMSLLSMLCCCIIDTQ